ncbi:MAG: hypothetical protein ACOX2F_02385 [bacterium]
MVKKVIYRKTEIEKLPNDKPVVYEIETESGKSNYVGVAQKGRVTERIKEHLGEIPGSVVKINQFSSIEKAREEEKKMIKKKQPKYNEKGK